MKRKVQRIRFAAVLGVAAACVLCAGLVMAAYRLPPTSVLTRAVSAVLPIPIAQIGDRFVSYRDYAENLRSTQRFYAAQLAEGGFEQPSAESISSLSLERLFFDSIVRELARERGVRLAARDVEAELHRRAQEVGGWAQLSSFTSRVYGWSPRDYAHYYLEPALLYRALDEDIRTRDPENAAVRARAQQAREEIQAGKDFSDVALAYGPAEGAAEHTIDLAAEHEDVTTAIDGMRPGDVSDVLELEDRITIMQLIDAADRSAVRIRSIDFPIHTAAERITEIRTRDQVRLFAPIQ